MVQKPSTLSIVAEWLRHRKQSGNTVFGTHEIEHGVPEFSCLFYMQTMNPGTAGRKFRELRQQPQLLKAYGIVLMPVDSDSKESKWQILTTSSSQSGTSPIAA